MIFKYIAPINHSLTTLFSSRANSIPPRINIRARDKIICVIFKLRIEKKLPTITNAKFDRALSRPFIAQKARAEYQKSADESVKKARNTSRHGRAGGGGGLGEFRVSRARRVSQLPVH